MKDAEFAYFLHLLKCGLDDTKPLAVPENVNIGKVIELSIRQNVETAVYEAFLRLDSPDLKQYSEDFKLAYYRAISKNSVQTIEYEQISKNFAASGIEFMPIKGIYLKRMYRAPYLRLMSDLDIYYEADNREVARKVMETLGYKTVSWNGVLADEDVFQKEPNISVELHRNFVYSNRLWDAHFANIFSKSIPCEKTQGEYFMSDETAYIFAIMHAAKHFQYTGFGIKPIMDLYVITKSKNPSREAVFYEMKKYGLSKFAKLLFSAMDAWFLGGISTAETDALAEFVSDSINYGSEEKSAFDTVVGMSKKVSGKPSKFNFYLSQIFVDKRVIYEKYPFCENHKIFLPLFFFIRLFSKLFNKESLEKVKRTATFYSKKNSEFYNNMEKISGIKLTDDRFKE